MTAAPHIAAPGGEFDRTAGRLDVYVNVPKPAEAPPGKAYQAAKNYVDLINAGQYGRAAELFGADAVLLEPTGHIAIGLDEIRTFYETTIGRMKPEIIAVAYLGDDTDCMVELSTKKQVNGEARFVLVSMDHFTLGADGKIARMIAFSRPPKPLG